jgi:hypothetical protein
LVRSNAMDFNEYTLTWLVRQRLRELEAEAQRERLARTARTPRRRLGVALGVVLVRLGSRLTRGERLAQTPTP